MCSRLTNFVRQSQPPNVLDQSPNFFAIVESLQTEVLRLTALLQRGQRPWHIWRCLVLPHIEFWPVLGPPPPPPTPLTFHNVKNHGGKENYQGTEDKQK